MSRPSKWEDRFVHIAKCAAQLGATDREIAETLEVSERTLNYWKIEHPDLMDALKLGKEAADERVERSLFHRAIGYKHDAVKMFQAGGEIISEHYVEHYPPDTTAAIFWLKNRRPKEWRDRHQQEISGPDGGEIPAIAVRFVQPGG